MNWHKRILTLLLMLSLMAGVEATMVSKETGSYTNIQKPALAVHHTVKGNSLHLHLTVTRFHFSIENMGKDNKQGEGHVHLYIDGKRVAKIFETHYVYPELTTGKHKVTLELAHNNHESYGVKQSFEIVVP
ncbi:hypothetical protein [Brevibacillus sp. SYSU BS000544]|uniref:hypothetical protein n=1 Tax=Brevibacillus sp. SYSU BS000544 TaxID=3416443 RepID=UPI003CE5053C